MMRRLRTFLRRFMSIGMAEQGIDPRCQCEPWKHVRWGVVAELRVPLPRFVARWLDQDAPRGRACWERY